MASSSSWKRCNAFRVHIKAGNLISGLGQHSCDFPAHSLGQTRNHDSLAHRMLLCAKDSFYKKLSKRRCISVRFPQLFHGCLKIRIFECVSGFFQPAVVHDIIIIQIFGRVIFQIRNFSSKTRNPAVEPATSLTTESGKCSFGTDVRKVSAARVNASLIVGLESSDKIVDLSDGVILIPKDKSRHLRHLRPGCWIISGFRFREWP